MTGKMRDPYIQQEFYTKNETDALLAPITAVTDEVESGTYSPAFTSSNAAKIAANNIVASRVKYTRVGSTCRVTMLLTLMWTVKDGTYPIDCTMTLPFDPSDNSVVGNILPNALVNAGYVGLVSQSGDLATFVPYAEAVPATYGDTYVMDLTFEIQ